MDGVYLPEDLQQSEAEDEVLASETGNVVILVVDGVVLDDLGVLGVLREPVLDHLHEGVLDSKNHVHQIIGGGKRNRGIGLGQLGVILHQLSFLHRLSEVQGLSDFVLEFSQKLQGLVKIWILHFQGADYSPVLNNNKYNLIMSLSKTIAQDNISLLKNTAAITIAYNLFTFLSKQKFFLKKTDDDTPLLRKLKKQLKEETLPQFLFFFLSLSSINTTMRLGISQNPGFWKLGFLVGFVFSYYFVQKFDFNFPLSLSFYVLARIGVIYLQNAQKKGLISKNIPIMKLLFLLLISILNYYLFLYPQYLPRKMVQNYKTYGNLNNKTWLDMRSVAMKVTGNYKIEL